MTRIFTLAVGAALALTGVVGGAVLAHHSYSMFDMRKTIVLNGTVQQFRWANPHAFIRVSVPVGEGTEVWSIEMTSPNNLIQEGWNRRTLRTGDDVRLYVHPLRSGTRGGSYVGARLADGTMLGSAE